MDLADPFLKISREVLHPKSIIKKESNRNLLGASKLIILYNTLLKSLCNLARGPL